MRKEDLARAALGRRSGFLSKNVRQDRPCLSAEGYFGFFLFPLEARSSYFSVEEDPLEK